MANSMQRLRLRNPNDCTHTPECAKYEQKSFDPETKEGLSAFLSDAFTSSVPSCAFRAECLPVCPASHLYFTAHKHPRMWEIRTRIVTYPETKHVKYGRHSGY